MGEFRRFFGETPETERSRYLRARMRAVSPNFPRKIRLLSLQRSSRICIE
jgi:hypothetical protein